MSDPNLGRRWWYWPPTQLTRPWLPRAMRASDEYATPTLLVIIPLAGALIIRTGRRPFRGCDGS